MGLNSKLLNFNKWLSNKKWAYKKVSIMLLIDRYPKYI